MKATHTKIINATNNPLQRILSDRADESRQTHANDLLSFLHGSVIAATVAKKMKMISCYNFINI